MINVIIPTYNRPELIEILLKKVAVYSGKLFKFSIYDSSTNDLTKNIFRLYEKETTCEVIYKRIDSSIDANRKAISAVGESNEDFFWLCGDKRSADYNALEEMLLKSNYWECSLIEISEPSCAPRCGEICKKQNEIQFGANDIEFIQKALMAFDGLGISNIK